MNLWLDLQRIRHIVAVLAKHLLVHILCTRLNWHGWPLPRETVAGPERLRIMFEELGGTFVKFGQMMALQPDILPLAYCNALFKLLDRMPPVDFEAIEQTFRAQFGKKPREVFTQFDPTPIATASIGQVHVAALGEYKVAVKIQRPSAPSEFAGDIRLMTGAMSLIRALRLKTLYWLLEPLREFVAWTHEELDYRIEARYTDRLGHHTQDSCKARVPAVMWDYTSSGVLTSEFFEGVTLLNYIRALEVDGEQPWIRRLHDSGFDPNQFACNIVHNFLNDVFVNGIFHADLHPANLIILPSHTVGYIDFGITGVMSTYLRRHLVMWLLAYSRGDLDRMCKTFLKISAPEPNADFNAFRRGMEQLIEDCYTTRNGQRRVSKKITIFMLDMMHLSRQTGIWPKRDVIKYIRSSIAIDGLVTRFAPTFDIGHYLEQYAAQLIKSHAMQRMIDFDTLFNWSSANGCLLQDGASRLTTLLDRIETNAFSGLTESYLPVSPGARTNQRIRQRAVHMALIIVVVSILIAVDKTPMRWGVNMFTAEVVLIVTSTANLLITLRKLI